MDRREFLKATTKAGAAVTTLGLLKNVTESIASQADPGCGCNAPTLPRRPYGTKGVKLSVIGLGGIVVMKAEQKHANKVVAEAFERGVNYFDVAPTYGDAEVKLGSALEPYRKKAFLACKTGERKRGPAKAQLDRSLKRLRTDHFDLYQLHGITDVQKDVDVSFAKGGAMEVFIDAKKAGVVRHLGFSAHSVEAAMTAMDRYDFDSILFPVNFACFYAGNFGGQVLQKAQEKGVSVLVIKALADCCWPPEDPDSKKFAKCWYKPLADPQQAAAALRWTLSRPVTAVLPPGEESLFRLAMQIAIDVKPITKAQESQVKEWAAKVTPLFSYKPKDKDRA